MMKYCEIVKFHGIFHITVDILERECYIRVKRTRI